MFRIVLCFTLLIALFIATNAYVATTQPPVAVADDRSCVILANGAVTVCVAPGHEEEIPKLLSELMPSKEDDEPKAQKPKGPSL